MSAYKYQIEELEADCERLRAEKVTANQLIEEYRVETGHLTAYWQSAELRAVAAEQKLQTLQGLPRYDLVTNYRCGDAIEEMESADENGTWVKASDLDAILKDTNE